MNVGHHQIEWNAEGFPSGVYFVRLKTSTHVMTQKMILMK